MVKAALANSAWLLGNTAAAIAFAAALDDPAGAQEQVLRRYLTRNADTAFGRQYGLRDFRSPAAFASRMTPMPRR